MERDFGVIQPESEWIIIPDCLSKTEALYSSVKDVYSTNIKPDYWLNTHNKIEGW